MNSIKISDYHESMGTLIDVRHPLDYQKSHDTRSINIYADKLMTDHKKYLKKDIKYYIICEKGIISKKVAAYLLYLGYNVVQVKY